MKERLQETKKEDGEEKSGEKDETKDGEEKESDKEDKEEGSEETTTEAEKEEGWFLYRCFLFGLGDVKSVQVEYGFFCTRYSKFIQ